MSPKLLQKAIAVSMMISCLTLVAQDKGMWRAVSSTARSITGDIALSDEKISINFTSFTMARIRSLSQADANAVFDAASDPGDTGSLYRLNIPSTRKFLHKNTLCGTDDATWMVTYVADRTLQLAFFSGEKPPVFTLDAITNSPELCGKFSYGK